MARKCSTIKRKTTESGLEVTLLDNTVVKIYSPKSFVLMTFATHAEAKKEFSKYRQGYKKI